jgi:Ni,Fe-hydrogenase III small subunit
MREPLLIAYEAMPEPRRVVALGDCALGCNLLGSAEDLIGPVEAILPVDLRIPGCPPTPDAIAEALLGLIDRGSAATPTTAPSSSTSGAS